MSDKREVPPTSSLARGAKNNPYQRVLLSYLHEDVDGVGPRHAVVHPERVPLQQVAVGPPLGLLRVRLALELDQAPVLDHALDHDDLAVGRLQHHGEDPLVLLHVPVPGREVLDVEGLGVEGGEGDAGGAEPIALGHVGSAHRAAVQEESGLLRRLARHVLDETVTLAVAC